LLVVQTGRHTRCVPAGLPRADGDDAERRRLEAFADGNAAGDCNHRLDDAPGRGEFLELAKKNWVRQPWRSDSTHPKPVPAFTKRRFPVFPSHDRDWVRSGGFERS
jgi:hypothetical protein